MSSACNFHLDPSKLVHRPIPPKFIKSQICNDLGAFKIIDEDAVNLFNVGQRMDLSPPGQREDYPSDILNQSYQWKQRNPGSEGDRARYDFGDQRLMPQNGPGYGESLEGQFEEATERYAGGGEGHCKGMYNASGIVSSINSTNKIFMPLQHQEQKKLFKIPINNIFNLFGRSSNLWMVMMIIMMFSPVVSGAKENEEMLLVVKTGIVISLLGGLVALKRKSSNDVKIKEKEDELDSSVQLLDKIRDGRTSELFKGSVFDKEVIIRKVLLGNKDRADREMDILRKTENANLQSTVKVILEVRLSRSIYLVYPHCGHNLSNFMDGKDDITLIRVGHDIVKAVAELHMLDIIHGDLNPDHILVKDSDFGPIVTISNMRRSHVVTEEYCKINQASEVWASSAVEKGEWATKRDDLWSLGLILSYIWSVDGQIHKRNFANILKPGMKLHGSHILEKLISCQQADAKTIYTHPIFWYQGALPFYFECLQKFLWRTKYEISALYSHQQSWIDCAKKETFFQDMQCYPKKAKKILVNDKKEKPNRKKKRPNHKIPNQEKQIQRRPDNKIPQYERKIQMIPDYKIPNQEKQIQIRPDCKIPNQEKQIQIRPDCKIPNQEKQIQIRPDCKMPNRENSKKKEKINYSDDPRHFIRFLRNLSVHAGQINNTTAFQDPKFFQDWVVNNGTYRQLVHYIFDNCNEYVDEQFWHEFSRYFVSSLLFK